ncbi:MAG: hypothetical protein MJ168_06970, partial [Clostridia bacterium]|nr:hypothetical protein [Clostridia bacterium]
MSKAHKTGRRILSLLLTAIMLLTTIVFFNIGSLAADLSAITVTDNGQGDPIYLYVPEQIYLKPTLNQFQVQQKYSFEWFADAVVDTSTHQIKSLRTGENASGNFYFYYEHASEVQVSYKYLDENLNEMTAYTESMSDSTTVSYANPNTVLRFADGSQDYSPYNTRSDALHTKFTVYSNEVNTSIVTQNSQSPKLLASAKGCYIEWLVRFNDTRELDQNGQPVVKTTKAYTYVYKPYLTPVGNAQRTKNPQGSASFGQDVTWISGVHGMASQGSYYAKSGTDRGLVAFSNSDANGTTLTPATGFAGATSSLYAHFPDRFRYSGWDNVRADSWISSEGSDYFTEKTFNYHDNSQGASGVVWNDNAFYNVCNAPTAKITVDASRYNNFSGIPNFTTGILMADNEGAKATGAYYIGDATGRTTESDEDSREKDKTDRGTTYWNNVNANQMTVAYGSYNSYASEAVSDGIKYNGRWNSPISLPSSTTTSTFKVKMGYFNHDADDVNDHYGGDTIWNISIIPISATLTNKTALRAAMNNIYSMFAKLSVLEDGTSRYYDEQSPAYSNLIAFLKAGGQLLASLDKTAITVNGTSYTIDSIPAAINAAVAAVNDSLENSTATVRFVAVGKNDNGVMTAQQIIDSATLTAIADDVKAYNYADTVSVTAPEIAGYTYQGYKKGELKQFNSAVSSDEYTVGNPDADTFMYYDDLCYTLYYTANAITATIDTNGGTNNLLKTETGALPTGFGGIGFPSYTANPEVETDINYTIDGNDVLAHSTQATANEQYQMLPFCAELEAGTAYTLSYSVAGASASDITFSFVTADSSIDVPADGVFIPDASGKAYLKIELLGNARSGKELRVSDLLLVETNQNALYLETSQAYPEIFEGSTVKTDMNYNVTGSDSVQLSTRFSTTLYTQKQLLPFYVDLNDGYNYQFSYNVSGIDKSNLVVTFVTADAKVYTPDADGRFTAEADGKAQLKIEVLTATSLVTGNFTDLYVANLDSKLVIPGQSNDEITLGIPVREGYKFDGWTLTGDNNAASPYGSLTPFNDTNVNDYRFGISSDTLTANWVEDTYTVVFRNVDGEVYSTQEVSRGGTATAPNVTPVLFGHTFSTWDTPLTNIQSNLYVEPVYAPIDINVNLSKASTTIYQRGTDTVTATF